jgi:urea transport system permease protein
LIVNFGKTSFSEAYPQGWLYLMGGTFIAVVMFFPNGLAGILEDNASLKGKALKLFSKLKELKSARAAKSSVEAPIEETP